ncbi:epsin-2 isoform X2 [Manduca sexta]|nr:epsin-2 isoform X2 [Manduca sexta]XP_037293627.1 epsin-2 isoform X2 [Manduca sexta]XP_037293628.1 epsin-2 isoform X2 [Manduca sexta]XP_037293629.1 epsin-2 isoform X2 [Manduca sexta]
MPRGRDEMQVNVAGLRRNIKNLAHNYSDAQVKVREATSNDPWGPSSTLMAEIADLTYNVMAFTEIMQMIWKRLNDHGKNWRHVYKALVLMEYLIRTGSEKVAMQCKENIFAIHTLKDFQYMEEGKDKGLHVREKAKSLVNLLKDDERLKNERARALKAKQRFAQSASAFGSDDALDTPSSPTFPALAGESPEWGRSERGGGGGGGAASAREAELARPLTAGEEELQLQLALAMSREEAEKDERRRRSDDVRLQLAISQSQQDFQTVPGSSEKKSDSSQSHLLDLLDVNLAPGPTAPSAAPGLDPWAVTSPRHMQETSSDAWSGVGSPAASSVPLASAAAPDPWAPTGGDPWAPLALSKSPPSVLSSPSSSELEQFDALSRRLHHNNHNNNADPDPFDLTALGDSLSPKPMSNAGMGGVAGVGGVGGAGVKKSPSSFLGENSSLVNLERLLQPAPASPAHNPFAPEAFAPPPPVRPSMNELKQQQLGLSGVPFASPAPFSASPAPAAAAPAPADPWAPAPVPAPRATSPWSPHHPPARHTPNPFLS